MSASKITKMLCSLLTVVLLMAPGAVMADGDAATPPPGGTEMQTYQWDNLPVGTTKTSQDQYKLHQIVLWIVTIAGIGVFAVMIYSIIFHRKSKHPVPATFHESTKVEVVWTVIPLVILVAIAVPATTSFLEQEDLSNPDIEIMVTASQWHWTYDYMGEDGLKYKSDLHPDHDKARQLGYEGDVTKIDNYLLEVGEREEMVVPVGKKIKLNITAERVIHAWWIPSFGVKRDAVPGKINAVQFTALETGTFRGQCTELCGTDHGFMPIVVKVVSEDDYKAWKVSQKEHLANLCSDEDKTFTMEESMKHGKQVYDNQCAVCHGANGEGGIGKPIANSPVVATNMKDKHIDIVVNGTNAGMPPFSHICKADIAAVVTYERNAFGNKAGDLIQPTDIK